MGRPVPDDCGPPLPKTFLVRLRCTHPACMHDTPVACFSSYEKALAFVADHLGCSPRADILSLPVDPAPGDL